MNTETTYIVETYREKSSTISKSFRQQSEAQEWIKKSPQEKETVQYIVWEIDLTHNHKPCIVDIYEYQGDTQ